MKNWLNNFGFTKREYNGLLVLMAILLLVSVLPYFYSIYFVKPGFVTNEERSAIRKLVLVNYKQPSYYTSTRHEVEEEGRTTSNLFRFDPNQINLQQWQQLGFSAKQANAILNYRNKGGKFYQPSDLKKMYTVSAEKYLQLEPYIEINNTFTNPYKSYPEKTTTAKKKLVIVEVNGADTLQLDQIRGIGAAFARRITSYRERLGGFHKKEQLMEVYGLDSVKFNEIKDQVTVDASVIRKININLADFEMLKNHPYLKYKQINAIIQYRNQHGKYNNVDDLKKVAILTPQNIQNLAPYLTF